MKKRNLLFPLILVIFPHVALLIYLLYAIDVNEISYTFPAIIETIIGIVGGFYALKMIQKHQSDLTKYFKKILIAVLIAIIFILVCGILNDYFFVGCIYGGILGAIVIFGFWITLAENPTDRKILFLINPLNYAILIVIAILICSALSPPSTPFL